MMRVQRAQRYARLFILIGLAGVLEVGCTKDATLQKNLGEVPTVNHAALVTEAEANYTYGPERNPVLVDTTNIRAPGGTLPTMTIATATRTDTTGRMATNRFTARLYSNGPYPTMGIDSGYNYIWRDSVTPGYPWRTLVVPKRLAAPMYWLKRDTTVTSYFGAPAPEPRLVKSSLGYGKCDNGCGGSHCIYKEQLRAFNALDETTVRIMRPPT